jgi:hypothetical protein
MSVVTEINQHYAAEHPVPRHTFEVSQKEIKRLTGFINQMVKIFIERNIEFPAEIRRFYLDHDPQRDAVRAKIKHDLTVLAQLKQDTIAHQSYQGR